MCQRFSCGTFTEVQIVKPKGKGLESWIGEKPQHTPRCVECDKELIQAVLDGHTIIRQA